MPFSLIASNIWARRTRSLLTILGIGVSIGVVIAVFALAANIREEFGTTIQITQADLLATQRGLAGFTGGSIPESRIQDIARYYGVERTTGFLLTTVSLNYAQMPQRSACEVIGDRGWALAEVEKQTLRIGLRADSSECEERIPMERDDLYRTEHQVFLDAAAGLREPSSPAPEAIVSMEITDAALRSWRKGRRIVM